MKLSVTSEYTFNGWRRIDIVLKFIIEPYAKAMVCSLYAKYVDDTLWSMCEMKDM